MPELKAIFGGDSMPFVREMQRMEAQAEATSQKIGRSMQSTVLNPRGPSNASAEYVSFWQKAGEESRAAFQKGLAGQRAGVGAGFTTGGASPLGSGKGRAGFATASSMFVSVARDSAASLASGAPITQVIAQQAPQVLQALAMMRLGMVAVGIAAAGVGSLIAYKIVKGLADAYTGTDKVRQSMVELAAATDRFRIKLEQAALARRLLANAAATDAQRAADASQYDQDAADAAAERQKEQLKAEFLAQKVLGFKQTEAELEKELLKIDLARAKAKEDEARKKLGANAEVKKAESASVSATQEYDDTFKNIDAAIKKAEKENPLEYPIFGMGATQESKLKRQAAVAQARNDAEQKFDEAKAKKEQADKDLTEAKRRNGQPEVDRAVAARTAVENAINTPAVNDTQKLSMRQNVSVSDMEQHGLFGIGNSTSIDIQKDIRDTLKRMEKQANSQLPGARRGRVNFGGGAR